MQTELSKLDNLLGKASNPWETTEMSTLRRAISYVTQYPCHTSPLGSDENAHSRDSNPMASIYKDKVKIQSFKFSSRYYTDT